MQLLRLKFGGVCVACAMVVGMGSSPTVAQCVPAPSGLVSWWDADSVSGTIASDIQDANDGTLKNGATTVPGFVGQAFSLDGSDDFVEVANEAAFDITGKLTVDAWVQVTSFLSQVVVAKGTGASIDRGWELRVGPNFEPDVISFCVLQDNGVFICKDQSIVGLLGTFMHVAGVFDKDLAGDARVKLYLNGVEGGTYTSLGAFSDIGLNDLPVTIGARADPTNRKFLDGLIDEVEIFNRALDASEIQAIFLAGSAGKCKGITIDATALSPQLMKIFGIGTFNSNTITTFELDPGTYSISGADRSFAFQVTGSGVLEYDAALDGFVSGRGTKALTILGYDINFDATALSSQLMKIFGIGNFISETLTTFTLIPGIYTISGADRVVVFQLTESGVLDFEMALDGFVAGFGSDTLTILGYDVTFDLTALSPQLVNIFSVGDFNTDTLTTFTLIPGPYTPTVGGDTFTFTLTNDEMISGLTSTLQGLPLSANGTSIISGIIECVPAPSGLVSWWPGDGNTNDIINGNPGSLQNGATFATGFVTSGNGQAFSFDGVDDHVDVGNPPEIVTLDAGTVDAWLFVPSDATPNAALAVFAYGGDNEAGCELWVQPNGDSSAFRANIFTISPGVPRNSIKTTNTFATDAWHHIAWVSTGSSYRVHVDGSLELVTVVLGVDDGTWFADVDAGTNDVVSIGARKALGTFGGGPVAPEFFEGLIDEVEVFDRALSASEIQTIFLAGSAGKCKDIDTDTDGDGLLDSTEVDIAMGSGCPDPGNPDSDSDTLSDGFEVLTLGTNPCSSDTDGDGVDDNIDPLPNQPGVTSGFLEDAARDMGTVLIPQLDLSLFNGPNDNANQGRRGALANRANEAANLIATGDIQGAIDKLTSLLEKIDGQSPPPDWMDDSPERDALAADVNLLILLLLLL